MFWYIAHQLLSFRLTTIAFSGESGSGKSYLCQQLIKQLCIEFTAADSDLLKTRTATMTVLRSLGSAGSVDNMHASKIVSRPASTV